MVQRVEQQWIGGYVNPQNETVTKWLATKLFLLVTMIYLKTVCIIII